MTEISGRGSRARPSPIKIVVVWRNGDAFFPGKRFVINPRQVSSFDSFLNYVTGGVEAQFGAVRNVYTPHQGHRVLSLDNMQHGGKYVAGGTEHFKKLDYFNITTVKPQRKKSEVIKPVVHSRIIVPARWRKILHESCTINVFTNGDILVPPVRILIPKCTLRSWEKVLAMVTEKVRLRTGAVHRLCTLDGAPLSSSLELENNHYYVATGVERFRLQPYFHWVPRKEVSQGCCLGDHVDLLPPVIRNGKHTRALFTDHTLKADSLFYAKAGRAKQQKHVSQTLLLHSSGESSVFRARSRRRETTGAAEIQEDEQIRVDLPIDQVEAKVVSEERRAAMPGPDSGAHPPFCSRGPTSASPRKVTVSLSLEQAAVPVTRPSESGWVTQTHSPTGSQAALDISARIKQTVKKLSRAAKADDRRPSIIDTWPRLQ